MEEIGRQRRSCATGFDLALHRRSRRAPAASLMRLRFNAEGVGFSKERREKTTLLQLSKMARLITADWRHTERPTRIACIGCRSRRQISTRGPAQVQRLLTLENPDLPLRSRARVDQVTATRRPYAKDGGQGSTLARALRKWRSSRMAVIILARRGESLCGRRCAATTSGERRALCTVWPGFPTSTGGENAGPERRSDGGSP